MHLLWWRPPWTQRRSRTRSARDRYHRSVRLLPSLFPRSLLTVPSPQSSIRPRRFQLPLRLAVRPVRALRRPVRDSEQHARDDPLRLGSVVVQSVQGRTVPTGREYRHQDGPDGVPEEWSWILKGESLHLLLRLDEC
jgi:hypothetical protein